MASVALLAWLLLVLQAWPAVCQWDRANKTNLDLPKVRDALVQLEDTLIYALAERANWGRNDPIYTPGTVTMPGGQALSLLEYVLCEREYLEGRLGRYTQQEREFMQGCAAPSALPPVPGLLTNCSSEVNANERIMARYLEEVVPAITAEGVDDGHYGPAATSDVSVLQVLSQRIHTGMLVAEAKYQAAAEQYPELMQAQNTAAVLDLLTDSAVEQQVVDRVRRKAIAYLQQLDTTEPPTTFKFDPEVVVRLYEQFVIPLSKEVQADYLVRRLEGC